MNYAMGDFMIIFTSICLVCVVAIAVILVLWTKRDREAWENAETTIQKSDWTVSGYYDRIEKAALDIARKRKPDDKIIILWLVVDGLRLNENGELEWIKRETETAKNQNVLYQPQQGINNVSPCFYPSTYPTYYPTYQTFGGGCYTSQNLQYNVTQSIDSQINALNSQINMNSIQMAQQAQNQYLISQLKDCCCIRNTQI